MSTIPPLFVPPEVLGLPIMTIVGGGSLFKLKKEILWGQVRVGMVFDECELYFFLFFLFTELRIAGLSDEDLALELSDALSSLRALQVQALPASF